MRFLALSSGSEDSKATLMLSTSKAVPNATVALGGGGGVVVVVVASASSVTDGDGPAE